MTAALNACLHQPEAGPVNHRKESSISAVVGQCRALPPMPEILARAREVMADENASFSEIDKVLETDRAMATRLLRLANSAYYGLSIPISTVQQAAAVLGVQTIYEILIVVSSSKMISRQIKGYGLSAREVWEHSLSVAYGGKFLAEKLFPELVNDAFMAGLIHDAGLLLLDPHIQEHSERIQAHFAEGGTIYETEMEIFGFDHGELAAHYLPQWKLPANQIHAVRFHHNPSMSGNDILSYILHVADFIGRGGNLEWHLTLDDTALFEIGLTSEELEVLADEVESSIDQVIEGLRL